MTSKKRKSLRWEQKQEDFEKLFSQLRKKVEPALADTLSENDLDRNLIENLPSMQETCPGLYEIYQLSYQTLIDEHLKKVGEYIRSNSPKVTGKKATFGPIIRQVGKDVAKWVVYSATYDIIKDTVKRLPPPDLKPLYPRKGEAPWGRSPRGP